MPPPRTSLDPEGYYACLGLKTSATLIAIRAAYRAKARVLHPDVPKTGNAAGFIALKQAYDVLSDQDQRESYDRKAKQAAMDAVKPEVFATRSAATAAPPYAYAASPRPSATTRRSHPSAAAEAAPGARATAAVPIRQPHIFDLPILLWVGIGAFLTLCVVQVVLHLRSPPQVAHIEIRPNAVTVPPLSPSAHQAILYGPAPARLPGTPNFYVIPAATPAVLWRLDSEHNTLVPIGQLPLFSSLEAVRLFRQNGLLEVLVDDHTHGYVQTIHLSPGDVDAAHRAYCSYNAGTAPMDGEVLEHRGRGTGSLQVINRAVQPAVVKLRDANGTVAFSVFLAPGGHTDLATLPAGSYEADYAIGELWSRACNTFAAGMRAKRLDAPVTIAPATILPITMPNDNRLVMATDSAGTPASDIADQDFEKK